ncbi:MarR family transcriptional regulator [bacterium AH-315-P15]|nr:MarR family transcriptional regulator [bacterium AH-315-P15]
MKKGGADEARLQAVAELLIFFSEHLRTVTYTKGCTAAQWAALRYFSSVNPTAATLVLFAKNHGTTKGTASRTIARLEEKRLITRKPHHLDRRKQIIKLTAKGRKHMERDPVHKVAKIIAQSGFEDLNDFTKKIVTLTRLR